MNSVFLWPQQTHRKVTGSVKFLSSAQNLEASVMESLVKVDPNNNNAKGQPNSLPNLDRRQKTPEEKVSAT